VAGEVVFKSNQRRVKQLYWHIEKETFAAATALRFRLQKEGLICCNTVCIKSFSRLWLQFCDVIIKCNQIVTVGGRFIDGYTHLTGFCRHWLILRKKICLCLCISALHLFSFERKTKNKAPQTCV